MADGCPVIVAQWQTTGCISHGVLGSIPGDWWPFYFPVSSQIFVLITCKKMIPPLENTCTPCTHNATNYV